MQVVIDGGEPIEVGNNVKIFYDDIPIELYDNGVPPLRHEQDARLVVTGTHEGLIYDVEDVDGKNLRTFSETAQEISANMTDN